MDSTTEIITFIDSPATIQSFTSKVPQETKHLYQNDFSKIYRESEINPYILKIIRNAIKNANSLMRSEINENYLYPDFRKWNVCVVNSVLFNLPCTINDVIILPINIVVASDDFTITMIHEKIHICQRLNPIWKTVVIDCWIKTNLTQIPYNVLKTYTNLPIVYNPDTVECNSVYFYKGVDGKIYYAILVFADGIVKSLWFEVSGNNAVKCDRQVFEYEHPYEMVAYQLSDKIYRDKTMH